MSYELIKTNVKHSLLKIFPKTGRFHQIRIQMASLGCPIVGDSKGSKKIELCATGISFKTATGEKVVNLEIPLIHSLALDLVGL